MIIFLHSLKVLSSKILSKPAKKQIYFGFYLKYFQNYAGVTYPLVSWFLWTAIEKMIGYFS